jgi:hypothetical protein
MRWGLRYLDSPKRIFQFLESWGDVSSVICERSEAIHLTASRKHGLLR